jgi:hypothetical protein
VEAEFSGGCADSGFTAAMGAPTLCAVGPVGGKAHSPEEYLESTASCRARRRWRGRSCGYPHHWVPMVFSLSRLVHWVLDAARLDARGLARQAEEVGLTALFLRTLPVWQRDDTPGLERTRAVLRRGLGWLDRLPRR